MIRFALIIAGGEGERLRPLTNDRPKPMIQVAGRPILERQVAWLARQGIEDVVFLCGYRAKVIREHFGDGSRFGVRAQYSVEETPLGRGGALKQGYRLVSPGQELLVALNGDNLTDQLLQPMIDHHQRNQAVATAMLTRLRSPYGIARTDRAGRILRFDEKPSLPHWLNAGIYILSPEFFDRLPDRGDHETTAFPELAAEGKLFAYRSRAFWRTIDTLKDLSEVEKELRERSLS
ncbi:MAG TPA: nucleotidyltransferase family protein [Chloroflexota bacterium]|nr:nucleotidyltransferase family protein [Chloroflexota bacterium]